jgi:bacterioferritin-associated ferredoxin
LNIIFIIGLRPASNMIVCICKGLSEKAIQGVVQDGAQTVADIGAACGAGTDCGTCIGSLEELISEEKVAETGRQIRALRAGCGASSGGTTHDGQRSGH